MAILLLIVGLILFIGLIIFHELGHFIVARRNGVTVEEFGIFFPPKIWGHKTKSGFLLTINALPLGGFVRLKGEHDSDKGNGTYGASKLSTKVKIMLAGVGMNLLAAFVLLTVLAWVGMPQLVNNQFTIKSDTKVSKSEVLVGAVESGSPAAKIGLQARDQLTAIASTAPHGASYTITNANTLPNITKSLAGQSVQLTYLRNGAQRQSTMTLLSKRVVVASQNTNNPKGYLGISPTNFILQRSTWSAPIVAAGLIKQFTVLTFQGLGTALKGVGSIFAGAVTSNHAAREAGQTQASGQVSGPVGIFVVLKDGSALGYQLMLMIVAVISLTLAIMNVLPIPALDGGKLFVTLIARLLHKRVTEGFENWAYGTSFALLMLVVIIVTFVDIKRFL